jgi:hypothetical protein
MSQLYAQRGQSSEFLFDSVTIEKGFIVCRPIHAGSSYDRVVEFGGRMFKVQIKSVYGVYRTNNRYRVNIMRESTKGRRAYKKGEYDVLAVYLWDKKSWFLFPWSPRQAIYFRPGDESENNWRIFCAT